jgi:hypothetical protein
MDDTTVPAETEAVRASQSVWDEVAKLAPLRSEDLRKLNEECRREEEAEAARRWNSGGQNNGKPGDQPHSTERLTPTQQRPRNGSAKDAQRDLEGIVNAILDAHRPRRPDS